MAIIPEFYKRLRDLCEERNMTVNELIKILDLSSGSPTAWKNGTIPRNATLVKIADYFGITIAELMGEENKKAPTEAGEREMSDAELKFALWGDCEDVSDDDLADVRRYAAFVRERKKDQK